MTSGTGVLCTIFPLSGNGPQTAHAYTQDSHSVAPPPLLSQAPPDPSTPPPSVSTFRSSSVLHSPVSQVPPRSVPVPGVPARVASVRHPPSLVPLDVLQSCSNTRDPTDAQMVRQLSVSRTSSVEPSRSPTGSVGNPGRMAPYNGI